MKVFYLPYQTLKIKWKESRRLAVPKIYCCVYDDQPIRRLIYIRKVPDSNLGLDTDCTDWGSSFLSLSSSLVVQLGTHVYNVLLTGYLMNLKSK
jgi:hypothetical protein